MTMMKKMITLALAALMVLSMVACGGSDKASGKGFGADSAVAVLENVWAQYADDEKAEYTVTLTLSVYVPFPSFFLTLIAPLAGLMVKYFFAFLPSFTPWVLYKSIKRWYYVWAKY